MADRTITFVASDGTGIPLKAHDNADGTWSLQGTVSATALPSGAATEATLAKLIPAANLATSQPAPLITATTLAIARATRTRCLILNRGTTQVYVGPATVTAANGFLLDPGAAVVVSWVGLVQGISIGATGQCYVADEYN